MRRAVRIPIRREFASATKAKNAIPSAGFSGAGFLGCYHVGAAACLHKQGYLPHPDDDSYTPYKMPLLTGVSAGSMIAAATCAGVNPEQDGMEVVLEAARRTRQLSLNQDGTSSKMVSLDVLTPGFSLIDQVEEPFRKALAKALGGYCERDKSDNNYSFHDIDPELFSRRFPVGSLRVGITDRRELWPPPLPFGDSNFMDAYRYVDGFRDMEDVVACSMLSSYIPGGTGLLNLHEVAPDVFGWLLKSDANANDTVGRAGARLKEMTSLGMVKHGKSHLPVMEKKSQLSNDDKSTDDAEENNQPNYYWDGGLADMFPTFDDNTIVVSPLNGLFGDYPSICPKLPTDDSDATISDGEGEVVSDPAKQNQQSAESSAFLQRLLRPYLPVTFRHCPKSELGFNPQNLQALRKMAFSSDDEELYLSFREGYDDAR